jgi:hypothetical protein
MVFGKLRRIWEKIKGGVKGVWNGVVRPILGAVAPVAGAAIGAYIGGPQGAVIGGQIGNAVGGLFNPQKQSDNSVCIGKVDEYLRSRNE